MTISDKHLITIKSRVRGGLLFGLQSFIIGNVEFLILISIDSKGPTLSWQAKTS